jgi:hypothetical protein
LSHFRSSNGFVGLNGWEKLLVSGLLLTNKLLWEAFFTVSRQEQDGKKAIILDDVYFLPRGTKLHSEVLGVSW